MAYLDDHNWLQEAWDEWEKTTSEEEKNKQWLDKYTIKGRIRLPKRRKDSGKQEV